MQPLMKTLYTVILYWLILVGIAYLLKTKFKNIEVSPFLIAYKKELGFKSVERKVKNKRWFEAYLVSSIIALAFSLVGFYYFVGSIAVHRLSGAGAQGGLVPIIPGVTLRGTTLIYVLLVLGLSATIHELSHAAAALHEGVPVKSTGFMIFFFMPAAFVEPVEEVFKSKTLYQKAKILSAGPAANLYLGLALFLVILAASHGMVGAEIVGVEPNSPAEHYGLKPGMIILSINDTPIKSIGDVGKVIKPYSSVKAVFNFTVKVKGQGLQSILVEKPANRSLVGITIRTPKAWGSMPDSIYYPLFQLISYGYIINISLALINAAPLFISDGGRLVSLIMERLIRGPGGKSLNFFIQITTVLLILFSLTLIPLG